MVTIAVIQNRRDCIALLHSILHPVIRANAATHQCHGKRHFVDRPLRPR